MKVKVLCKYGRFPVANSGTCSYLVSCGLENIVLDMGCSSLSKLLATIEIQDISAVVITHLHGDHSADLIAFYYMATFLRAGGRLNKRIKLYLPISAKEEYDNYSDTFDIVYMLDGGADILNGISLSFYEVMHSIQTYAVRIEYNDNAIAYMSDSRLCDSLKYLSKNVDILIGDACVLQVEHSRKSPHLSVTELANLARVNNVKKLILGHLPDLNHDKILAEAKAGFPNSILAEDDKEYVV